MPYLQLPFDPDQVLNIEVSQESALFYEKYNIWNDLAGFPLGSGLQIPGGRELK